MMVVVASVTAVLLLPEGTDAGWPLSEVFAEVDDPDVKVRESVADEKAIVGKVFGREGIVTAGGVADAEICGDGGADALEDTIVKGFPHMVKRPIALADVVVVCPIDITAATLVGPLIVLVHPSKVSKPLIKEV